MKHRWLWCLVLVVGFVGVLWVADNIGPPSPPRDRSGIEHNPIETDPAFGPMIAEADREARRHLDEHRVREGRPGVSWRGDLHYYDAVKKSYLKEKYGIDWRTRAEMNPRIAID